jgi:integrase
VVQPPDQPKRLSLAKLPFGDDEIGVLEPQQLPPELRIARMMNNGRAMCRSSSNDLLTVTVKSCCGRTVPKLDSLTRLTAEQGRRVLGVFDRDTLRGIRDYAMVAVLLGCGLRRAEVVLGVQGSQLREEHWVFADLVGKGGDVRTVPVPFWIAAALRTLIAEAKITNSPIFRANQQRGRAANGFSAKVIWVL